MDEEFLRIEWILNKVELRRLQLHSKTFTVAHVAITEGDDARVLGETPPLLVVDRKDRCKNVVVNSDLNELLAVIVTKRAVMPAPGKSGLEDPME